MLDVNVYHACAFTHLLLPKLLERKNDKEKLMRTALIINASSSHLKALPNGGVYSASKRFMTMYSLELGRELRESYPMVDF